MSPGHTGPRTAELEYYPDFPDWCESQDLKAVCINVPGLGRRSFLQCIYQLKNWSRQINACCHYVKFSFPDSGPVSVFAFAYMYQAVAEFIRNYEKDPQETLRNYLRTG